ncbi:MAG: hypothetical protein U0525_06515 [Patescibacteria group bacterium]
MLFTIVLLSKNRQEIQLKLSKSSTKRQTSISKNTPQVIPENVLNSSLYYLHNGYLYRKIGLLLPPEILFKADSYDVSSDNSKIVYSVYPEVDPYKDENPKVYIYDVNTKKKIEVKLSDYDRLRGLEFSSNGDLLVVDYGSSANGVMKFFNLGNGKLLGASPMDSLFG